MRWLKLECLKKESIADFFFNTSLLVFTFFSPYGKKGGESSSSLLKVFLKVFHSQIYP